ASRRVLVLVLVLVLVQVLAAAVAAINRAVLAIRDQALAASRVRPAMPRRVLVAMTGSRAAHRRMNPAWA
ncbi:hypothetical protein, partial [Achromobacter xylosoxidans]|uniref:hypothetical protein n=1 Tax=Alcaligenes xylosoxydans xylosoxydans TaxID=85698 RepID=UPI0015C5DB8A